VLASEFKDTPFMLIARAGEKMFHGVYGRWGRAAS